ncbi:MAG: hypothetical protein ACOX0E_06585 [Syntrophomonadaceae bacterium]|jgi:hypothetical protein
MKKKWGKGEPVNLSDLLKITPVANEIMQLSEELDMSSTDVMWIVAQIIDNGDEFDGQQFMKIHDDEDNSPENEWDEIDLENVDESIEQSMYSVNVKIASNGRFPEIGFKAGINDKEDINYFFDMVMEMLEKID